MGLPLLDSGSLQVSEIHKIYYETRGNPKGPPVLFLHGGPGGGVRESDLELFEDSSVHLICFDQRGAGRSRPRGERRENTTTDLISDIIQLQDHLGLESTHLVGGSWGSTLALAYAIAQPKRVQSMLLHGIFLCRELEIIWFYEWGANQIFPDEYERYLKALTRISEEGALASYYEQLHKGSEEEKNKAAQAWARWEAVNSFLDPSDDQLAAFTDPKQAITLSQMETHYFINGAFFEEDDFIINNAHKIQNIPCTIIQGRYDTICPMKSAWDLHEALPKSKLKTVTRAAHDSQEAELKKALKDAIAKI